MKIYSDDYVKFSNSNNFPVFHHTLPTVGSILKQSNIYSYLNFFICGGSIRKLITGAKFDFDLDVFVNDFSSVSNIQIVQQGHISKCDYICELTKKKIQIILNREIEDFTLENLFKSFDFTICQFGFDGPRLYASEEAILDTRDKILRLTEETKQKFYKMKQEHTLGSTCLRVFKYMDEGFVLEDNSKNLIRSYITNYLKIKPLFDPTTFSHIIKIDIDSFSTSFDKYQKVMS